jgi:HAMP domain-containing protein
LLHRQMHALMWNRGKIALLAVASGLLVASLFSLWLTRPIVEVAAVAEKMSLGQTDVRLNLKCRGEVGRVYQSLERLKESILYAQRRLDNRPQPAEGQSEKEKPQTEKAAQGERRWPKVR